MNVFYAALALIYETPIILDFHIYIITMIKKKEYSTLYE